MKKFFNIVLSSIVLGGLFGSCQNEDNFFEEGEGFLKMKMVVNNNLTRAEGEEASLAEKCVIYISSEKGLIYKYKGIDNVPSRLALKSGGYVAEAWTGDSVTASFDKKFYRAYEPFTITKGNVENVVLNCKIANVVASVNPEPIIAEALKNYKVTIGNTRGSLDFTAENVATAHGYFMMPNGDTSLTWTITGLKEDGSEFTKSGIIENVERAHEYVLNIRYTPSSTEVGGSFITITVDDTEIVVEDEIQLTAAPIITGVGYDIKSTVSAPSGKFERRSVYVQAVGELKNVLVNITEYAAYGLPKAEFDFITMAADERTNIEAAGATCEYAYDADADLSTARVSFSDEMLNRLPNGEYPITIKATDSYGKSTTAVLNILVSDASVIPNETPWTAVYSYSATVTANVVKEGVANPGFRYRPVGTADWTTVTVADVAAGSTISATLTGLQAGTKYEYQTIADEFTNPDSMYFTTEAVFQIPNASFEDWSNNSNDVLLPAAGGVTSFWDSGNHGAAKASTVLTEGVTEMYHSGSKSARLKSKFASVLGIGKFAAGNIFAGTYVGTDGMDGILSFGREFNGSRPVKLRGWANYRPGIVDKGGDAIANDVNDNGQIYVALTTQAYEIRTKSSNRQLFNPEDAGVLAYGEITWTENFGPDGALQQFEITLDYRDAAQLTRASHLVIVASASKFGDYFQGSTSSVLYLDDLELVYE